MKEKKAYERALVSKEKADRKARLALLSLIEACPHNVIWEGEYRPSSWFSPEPPFRVCVCCGLAEEGWGCGYQVLTAKQGREVLEVERDKAFGKRNIFISNELSYEIARGRQSLRELVLGEFAEEGV